VDISNPRFEQRRQEGQSEIVSFHEVRLGFVELYPSSPAACLDVQKSKKELVTCSKLGTDFGNTKN
jgi:hypothetical protein